MNDISIAVKRIREEIEEARERSPYGQDVKLVAVTKFHSIESMEAVISSGVTDVGENRVQEMERKHNTIPYPVTWHLQGHLQKNKVKKAVALADLIQSVDSVELLRDIDKRARALGKVQRILLEFNVSGEESKYGFPPEEIGVAVEAAKTCSSVEVQGLMCMAPLYERVEDTRPVFQAGRKLWEQLQTEFPAGQITILSMGMSRDFKIAIEEGATMIRIGTAIFGVRKREEK